MGRRHAGARRHGELEQAEAAGGVVGIEQDAYPERAEPDDLLRRGRG